MKTRTELGKESEIKGERGNVTMRRKIEIFV